MIAKVILGTMNNARKLVSIVEKYHMMQNFAAAGM